MIYPVSSKFIEQETEYLQDYGDTVEAMTIKNVKVFGKILAAEILLAVANEGCLIVDIDGKIKKELSYLIKKHHI